MRIDRVALKRFVTNYWFAPIYVGLIVLAAHDHVFTPRFWFTGAVLILLAIGQQFIHARKRRRSGLSANDN